MVRLMCTFRLAVLAFAASAQQAPPLNISTRPFEIDVVFPHNETYKKTKIIPIFVAVQNLTP
jgi:hypothetical protein